MNQLHTKAAIQARQTIWRVEEGSRGLLLACYRALDDEAEERLGFQPEPLSLWIKRQDGTAAELTGGYDRAEAADGCLRLSGTLRSDSGATFRIEDTILPFSGDPDGLSFEWSREVHVETAGEDAEGFTSRLSFYPQSEQSLHEYDAFAPGVWYGGGGNVVGGAIASNYGHCDIHIREMRLPLPLLMLRDKHTGATVSISRAGGQPSSGADETDPEWLVDESVRFGSFGVHRPTPEGRVRLDYLYPGWEGEINYVSRSVPWVRRSHPVRAGFSHRFSIVIRFDDGASTFSEAITREWRSVFARFRPQVERLDVQALYDNGLKLLGDYCQDYNGVVGLPFKTSLPDGEITGNAMVMGFVGQQLPAAYQMIRHGLRSSDQTLVDQGSAIVDFWVNRSMTDCGLPKTWYEPYWEETDIFTNRDVDLRTMSDGMEGALDAYNVLADAGERRDAWLGFAVRFGDFLADNQNEDGSYFRLYDLEGKPAHEGKFNTSNPIRFLLRLHRVTGDERYLAAAVAAGEFCYEHVYAKFQYVGGTSDNDNTVDKEAGTMAMNAFLALYEATGESRWLEAFRAAADYTETWVFAWSYPVAADRQSGTPLTDGLIGRSLVATGHSYVDMYMAYKPAQYYRLYLFTGDEHYLQVALLLQHNANRPADWDGGKGYSHRGFIEEGAGVAEMVYRPIGVWLTWCTVAQLEPLSELEERFGRLAIDEIERLPLAERIRLNSINF